MKKLLPLAFFFFMCLSGCDKISYSKPETIFSEYVDISSEGLLPGFEYVFDSFDSISKTTKEFSCTLLLSLRYSDYCDKKIIPFNIEYSSPESDSIITLKMNFPLFTDDDRNMGKGNFGIYEKSVPIIDNVEFSEGFYVAVSSPDKISKGLLSIGIVANKGKDYK